MCASIGRGTGFLLIGRCRQARSRGRTRPSGSDHGSSTHTVTRPRDFSKPPWPTVSGVAVDDVARCCVSSERSLPTWCGAGGVPWSDEHDTENCPVHRDPEQRAADLWVRFRCWRRRRSDCGVAIGHPAGSSSVVSVVLRIATTTWPGARCWSRIGETWRLGTCCGSRVRSSAAAREGRNVPRGLAWWRRRCSRCALATRGVAA